MTRTSLIPIRLLAETLTIVVLGEALVAQLLAWAAPPLPALAAGLTNACALAALTAPLLYWRAMNAVHLSRRAPEAGRGAGAAAGLLHATPAPAADAASGPGAAAEQSVMRSVAHQRRRRAIVLTALAQVSGLLLTVGALAYVKARNDDEARLLFERHAERLESEVVRRFQQPVYGLKGARGAYAAAGRLSLAQFRAFVLSRELATEFPGVSGFGLIERVPRAELPGFIAAQRAAGVPDFDVNTRGNAPDLYPVRYVEPLARNHQARGFDVGAEPVRREAVERAIARAEPALTGRVTLVSGDPGRPGFLYLVPVFREGTDPTNVEQRRAALLGLVYAPISAGQLLSGAARAADGMLDFQLFDGAREQADAQVFDSAAQARAEPAYSGARSLSIGGRTLTLRIVSSEAFEAQRDHGPLLPLAVGGTLLSLLLALAVWSLAAGGVRAQTLADRMTADLDRLAQVVRHTSNAVLITDREQRITWINEGFTRLTGHDLDSARGRTPGELLGSGKADPAVLRKLDQAVAEGRACRVEILNRARDGREFWVDTELQPLHDSAGALIGYMEIATDITDRRRANDQLESATRALARERQRLDDILRGTHAGTWEWNLQTGQIIFNERWAGMLGYTLAELEPVSVDTFWQLLLPEDREPTSATLQRHLDGQTEQYEAELRMRHRSGAVVWVLTRGRVSSRSADGRPEWVAGTHLDITDRKLTEALARDSEHLMRVVTDNMPARIAYWDADRRLRFGNRGFYDHFGGSPQTQLGRHSTEVLGEARARAGEPAVAQVLQGLPQHIEREREGPDGETLHELTHMIPDQHEGRVQGYFVLTLDVSVIKQAEAALRRNNTELAAARDRAEQSSVAKSQFLANMSHEIRTPMNAILGMLKLLQRTPLSAQQLDYADKTERAAQALLGLLNDILDFSKIEAGKMTLDPRPFRIERLLRDLSVILAANLGDKPVEVLFDIDPTLPPALLGDDLRLQQVLVNLAGNAIKFTPQGEVVVSLALRRQAEGRCRIRFAVRDTGIGIAPALHAHIFSGFSQAEASTTRRFGGTGLGLSISQRLVGLMGGRIELDSTPGEGSSFHFELELPVADAAVAASAAQATVQAPQRVLAVDDNAAARDVLGSMLQQLGWPAEVVADADEALSRLDAAEAAGQPFDLVLVDWLMPQQDGWQASRRIRERRGQGAGGRLPLLMMLTAQGRDKLAQQPLTEQALLDGFLVKPVTAAMLAEAVQQARQGGAGPATAPLQALPRRLAGMRLLVVEDNANNQQVARELLEGEGAEVMLADDGERGVAAVRDSRQAFDAVLMDLQMPRMDGFTAATLLREHFGPAQLPIIAITANAMPSDRDACLAAGMNDHVGKPFELDELVAVLLRHVRPATAGARTADAAAAPAPRPPALPEDLLAEAQRLGIGLRSAVDRLGGRADLWLRTAQGFAAELPRHIREHEAQLAQCDLKAAARQLHTLKGLAATLGAEALAGAAAQAESQLLASPARAELALDPTLRAAVRLTAAAFDALIERLRALPQAGAAAAATAGAEGAGIAPDADRARLHAALTPLMALLRDTDMAATDSFAALMAQHEAGFCDALQPLSNAMAALDFEAALGACESLAVALATTPATKSATTPATTLTD